MQIPKEVQELSDICKLVQEFLAKNYSPHCQVIISENAIKLTADVIYIPSGDVLYSEERLVEIGQ